MYHLHLAHEKDAQGRWFVNMFFVQSPPNHEAHALFLVMTNERCLNSRGSLSIDFSSFILDMGPKFL
jgi:hypothetical protein